MSLLALQRVSVEVSAGIPLFQNVTFQINPGDRIGVVGANGSGKSTLLRLLAGAEEPASGTVVRRRGLRTGYLRQETPTKGLSSGERMRSEIERLLEDSADLLLLDEPTNHLDARAQVWLREALERSGAAVVLVSHDRAFLDAATSETLWLDRGRVGLFAGGYTEALERKELATRRVGGEYEAQRDRQAAAERAAQRRASLAVKVAKAPPGARLSQDFYGRKASKVARTGRLLRERVLHEPKVEKPWEDSPIPALTFAAAGRGAEVLVEARGLAKELGGKRLFNGVDFHVPRGMKLALAGPNGSGKTTLMRLILGDLAPDGGSLRVSDRAQIGYLAQEGENLPKRLSAVGLCLEVCTDETRVRTVLGCLKLPAEVVTRPMATLSAGERTKAGLARLLLSGANLLLLDEPTNHLEIEARIALEQALVGYEGAVVFVSHDRVFMEAIADDVIEFGG